MTKLQKRIATTIATLSLLSQAVLPAFAATELVVTGNGTDSNNQVQLNQNSTTYVQQTNTTQISNNVETKAETGNNTAKDNTSGDVTIDTGDATSKVAVQNVANSNSAEVQSCNCAGDTTVTVTENGSGTNNHAVVNQGDTTQVYQDNVAHIDNNVQAKAETGDNRAEDNTGGDVNVLSGNAKSIVGISNTANMNQASVAPSGDGSGSVTAIIAGNGEDSTNGIKLNLDPSVWVDQKNVTDIANDVYAKAETGDNKVDDNTGGSAGVDTGDATVKAFVDNAAGFNVANVDGCCTSDILAKVAENGTDTQNRIQANLGSTLSAVQDNLCGYGFPDHQYGDLFFGFQSFDGFKSHPCFDNNLSLNGSTGDNKVEDSTGNVYGDPMVYTGDAYTETGVSNQGGSNTFGTSVQAPSQDWNIPGTGINLSISLDWADLLSLLGYNV